MTLIGESSGRAIVSIDSTKALVRISVIAINS